MNPLGIIFILLGIYSIAGAKFNWDWFMENGIARIVSSIFGGRERARIFYGVLGLGFIILGLLGMFGIVDLT